MGKNKIRTESRPSQKASYDIVRMSNQRSF